MPNQCKLWMMRGGTLLIMGHRVKGPYRNWVIGQGHYCPHSLPCKGMPRFALSSLFFCFGHKSGGEECHGYMNMKFFIQRIERERFFKSRRKGAATSPEFFFFLRKRMEKTDANYVFCDHHLKTIVYLFLYFFGHRRSLKIPIPPS